MSVIDEFLAAYENEFDYWEGAARKGRQIAETGLSISGLRAIATSRAKSVDKLAQKVLERDRQKHYERVSDVFTDIVDLAGVRIALYFPGQMDEVENLVTSLFNVVDRKVFPEMPSTRPTARFMGYAARHFRVRIPAAALADDEVHFGSALIEVQVASVLMHAWAEVDHDLFYKPTGGTPSSAEYALLDQLNGLVLSGEIALEQLQLAADRRVSEGQAVFRDRYELAEYLRGQLVGTGRTISESALGGVDVLFAYLTQHGPAKPSALAPYLSDLDGQFERRPLADQILDLLLADSPDQYQSLRRAMADARRFPAKGDGFADPRLDAAAGEFIRKWAEFENLLAEGVGGGRKMPLNQRFAAAQQAGLFEPELLIDLQVILTLRNRLVHGQLGSRLEDLGRFASQLTQAAGTIDVIMNSIRSRNSSEGDSGRS